MLVIGRILLFSIFLFIIFINQNKDNLLRRFNNKWVLMFVKYQLFLTRISYIIYPIIILFGLIELLVGIHFIKTHPIPYDKIGIDLHIYIKKD